MPKLIAVMMIGTDGQAVEPVGQVDRVRRADHDERREGEEEPAEVEQDVLEEGQRQAGTERVAGQARDGDRGGQRHDRLGHDPGAARQPLAVAL